MDRHSCSSSPATVSKESIIYSPVSIALYCVVGVLTVFVLINVGIDLYLRKRRNREETQDRDIVERDFDPEIQIESIEDRINHPTFVEDSENVVMSNDLPVNTDYTKCPDSPK